MRSFLDTLLLIGALQGLIVGAVLLLNRQTVYAVRILALLLLLLALACLKIYLNNTGILATPVGLLVDAFVPFILVMPVGPMIYFYTLSETDPLFRIRATDLKHFYATVIDLVQHLAAICFALLVVLGWVSPNNSGFGTWFDNYNVFADIPRWGSLTIYLYLSFRHVGNARFQHADADGALAPSARLRQILWGFFALDLIWLCYLIPYEIPALSEPLVRAVDWYPLYLPMVVMIYWLGIRCLIAHRAERLLQTTNKLQLAPELIAITVQSLDKAMVEEGRYRDPDISLPQLASHLQVSPKVLSAVIRQQTGKSFNEYINHFRVEEIKSRLRQPESRKYTITALAFESGFNSQPTFQRAFKSVTGVTPTEFQKQHSNSHSISE